MNGPIIAAGLGNPGQRYAGTRHNLGFMVVDRLAARLQARWRIASGPYLEADGGALKLIKPTTYMNSSGVAVAQVVRQLQLDLSALLVLLDDVHLSLGTLRLKRRGSDGGHRGLASVIEQLDSREIPRLRLGIGTPPEGEDRIGYVLSRFTDDEMPVVDEMVEIGADAVTSFVETGIERTMNAVNPTV